MSFHHGRALLLGLASMIVVAACAAPAPPPPSVAEIVAAPPPPAPPDPPAAPDPPRLSIEEARAAAEELREPWGQVAYRDAAEQGAWAAAQGLDEARIRALLAPLMAACAAQPDRDHPSCKGIQSEGADAAAMETVTAILGAIGDPSARAAALRGSSARWLMALEGRGVWRAGMALTRLLERRLADAVTACQPPSEAEIAEARASLQDFALVARDPQGTLTARWPTAAELDELAYFHAVVRDSGAEVGAAVEDRRAPPLGDDHPDLARRATLREEAKAALLAGDAERHLRAVEAYLATLGYPDRLRLSEEGDMRWGGAAASFMMREAARSAELLGRYAVAEALYRRAAPGGGMCGTSVESRREDQISAVIRVAEQSRGCRAVAAERLYSIAHDTQHLYGPARLSRAGFDVSRAYAGALHTLGRDDTAALDAALQALPSRSAEALRRLAREGTEAWAARLRAIAGYTDSARGAAIPRLLDLLDRGESRSAVLDAIGQLAEDRGFDPCLRTSFMIGWGRGYSGRRVENVMKRCETRLDAATMATLQKRIAAHAGGPEPRTRELVAQVLGRLGLASARPTLTGMLRDRHQTGQICTSDDAGKQVCEPHYPVARAAREALEALRAADAMRARQRAARRP